MRDERRTRSWRWRGQAREALVVGTRPYRHLLGRRGHRRPSDQQPGTAVGCGAHGDRRDRFDDLVGRHVRLSRRPPDAKRTYGYARMEAIGALVNGGMLFLVAGYILWEAVGRFREPPSVAYDRKSTRLNSSH